jgi:hypothetical protein
MFGFFGRGDLSGDDGWYIDDVHIDQALDTALTLSVDNATIASPLACGNCGSGGGTGITAALESDPTSLAAPGQIVTLTAKNSTADRCINGILQYQFWNDANADGVVGPAPDTLLRDWTDNANFVAAPLSTIQYGVKVRCSTEPNCVGTGSPTAVKAINITCPGGPFPQTIKVNKVSGNSVTIDWPGSAVSVDAVRGSLTGNALAPATKILKSVPAGTGFNGSVNLCLATNSAPTNSIPEATVLAPGDGFYYLVRGQAGQKYMSGNVKERGGPSGGFCNGSSQRDTELTADPVASGCP